MWKGIAQKVHGYDAIDTDDAVTVRSEVARLTRLFDRAVKTNTMNDPDHYAPASGISTDDAQRGLRTRTNQQFQPFQPQPGNLNTSSPATIAVPGLTADPDASPATQLPVPPPTNDEVAKDVETMPGTLPNVAPVSPASTPNGGVVPEVIAPPIPESSDIDSSPATSATVPNGKDKV